MRLLNTFGVVGLIACSGSDKSLIVQNPAPTADIISHDDGSEILEGFVVTLEGVVSDSNHTPDQLTTRWVINGDVVCDDIIPDEDGSTFCEAVFDTDDTEISLEVRDAEQKFGEDSINVVIVETEAPIAEIVSPMGNGVYYSDKKITFEGLLSDAEDNVDQLVAYWESDIDGVLSGVDAIPDSSGGILGYEYLTEGEHAIELHVEDTTGKTSTESLIINVGPPNSAPLCEILTPLDGSAGPQGETIQFTATASDVDVEPDWLTVTWTSDKDGEIGNSTPTSDGDISFSYAGLSVNSHSITMRVTDEVGETCSKAIDYTVGTAPSITIDTPTDGDIINEGSNISFSATVSDAQDQPNDVALDWVANGTSISTQGATSSGTASFSTNSLTYGSYNLIVTATDSDGLTDSDQINFTVNGRPTAPVVSINPDPASTTDALTVSIDTPSIDPEGNTPTYSYEWQLGGQVQTAYTSSSLPSSATNKGEQWTVRVIPSDGMTTGTAGTASITIQNTAPVLSGLSITPTGSTYNDDMLTCSATVTDPDESPTPSYQWSIDGNIVGNAATLDLSSVGAMPDDVVLCTVSVSDSDNATATDSISKNITNRAPTLSNTSISPNTGITTSTELTCSSTVTDADSEVLTPNYIWSVGSNNNAGTGSTLQLTPSLGNPGDGIVCTVDVADGYGGSAVDTATTVITNTDPVISDVSINYSGDLTSTTQLTCAYTATDADNQTLTPSYTWTNLSTNTQFASTASTLQLTPSIVGPTDVVECSVTVTDTSNGSATLAASDTVGNTDPTFIISSTITTTGTQVGDTWTCFASGTDQDDGARTATYIWQDATGTTIQSGDTLVLSASNSNPSEAISCVATITDTQNATATSTASETVSNTAPIFSVAASLSPSSASTSTLLICSGTASDADGDTPTLSYSWSNSNGSTYGSTGNTLQLTPNTVSPNETVTCNITATDDQQVIVSSTASITIDNTLPTVTASISANGTSNTGELTCSATGSDVDDFPTAPTFSYEWFNASGSLGTSNPLQLDATMGVDGDSIDCVVTGTDLSGGQVTSTATHIITNTAPVIDSIALTPNTIDANTASVTCTVSSSDADGDTVTESFAWFVDNQLQSETTNMYSGPFIVGTLLACRSTPNDGKTDGSVVEDTATVQNTEPVVDSVTLSPSTVYTNDTITATAMLSDVDGSQSLSANYEWFVDGSSVQNGSSNTLDGVSLFDRDQTVYVEVTPNDGVADGTPVQSSSITISNTAPVMTSVTVTPDPAIAGTDDLICDVTATDADGDAIVYTYEWSDSIGVRQTTPETPDLSDDYLAAGLSEDTWTCDVTPYDGTVYGSALSDSVTVESGCWSLSFDGVDDYVQTTNNPFSSSELTDGTVSLWFNPSSVDNGGASIFSLEGYVQLYHNGNGIVGACTDGLCTTIQSNRALSADKWYQLVVTWQGTSTSFYINSDLQDTTVSSNSPNLDVTNRPLALGRHGNFNRLEFVYGLIDNIAIWDRALSPSEVSTLLDKQAVVFQDSLLLWTVDEMAGNSLFDQGGINGTIDGATWVNSCPEEDLDGDGNAAWEDCNDNDASVYNTCLDGTSANQASTSCKTILDDGFSTGDGLYWIDPDGSGAFEAYCDMTTDGGGWTLISVHSDDGNFNWTWNNRDYFTTDTTTFGNLNQLNYDYKSPALHNASLNELLFIHNPTGVWATYDVGQQSDFGTFIDGYSDHSCYSSTGGFNMVAGTLTVTGRMCSTQMYINPADHEAGCSSGGNSTRGPAWSVYNNNGCYLDDPGIYSALGPVSSSGGVNGVAYQNDEWLIQTQQKFGIGYGWAIGSDGTPTGNGTNYMQVYVRD